MTTLKAPRCALLLFLLAPAASAQQGGIEIFAGETLFDAGIRTNLTWLSRDRDELRSGTDSVSNPLGTSLRDDRLVLGLDYGLRHDVTISALIPYVDKRFESGGTRRDADGLGDIALLAKKLVYHDAWRQGGFNAALIGGVELPTGEDDARDGGVLLPANAQPGTGAWNPFVALSATYEQGRKRFDSTLFLKLNGENDDDLDRGDFLTFDISAKYRFYHAKYPGPTAGAKLGLQYRHQDRDELDGVSLSNSGSDLVLLKASLGGHPTPDTDVSFTWEEPLWEDVNGTQLGRGSRLVLKLGMRF